LSYAVIFRTISITALLLVAGLPLFSQPVAHAQVGDGTVTPDGPAPLTVTTGPEQDRELEKRAQGLETQLICPICPGETLDQSFVQISQDMKRILREKLLEGQDEDQIKDFFVDRYGPSVLAAPPRSGFNLVTWVVPPAAVALGIILLAFVMRGMRRGDADPVAAGVGGPVTEGDLSDYLAEVDRDLSLGGPGIATLDDDTGDNPGHNAERSAED
jgi:cytochrome c-type biogenesis protein CcmH